MAAGAGLEAGSHRPDMGSHMNVEWDYTARAFLSQLPVQEQHRVFHAVDRLSGNWDALRGSLLFAVAPVGPADERDLYRLQAGQDLSVLLRRRGDTIIVVDVVRQGQIDGLRQLRRRA
ncbi:hypothetical protein STAQ_18260 [Allostella sp. ATCC 35155]|nr:hypothetical protein STAQ_18260 [Stella sp. ATCC 35155]